MKTPSSDDLRDAFALGGVHTERVSSTQFVMGIAPRPAVSTRTFIQHVSVLSVTLTAAAQAMVVTTTYPTMEDDIKGGKKKRIAEQKEMKRAVLGPKRSRWS